MKEKIYTIPISEAFQQQGNCPFCTISERLDKQYTETTLGAGMMEPDIRMMTNEKGFCKTHYNKMRELNTALPLALIIQTHLSENVLSAFDAKPLKKRSRFSSKPSVKDAAMQVAERLGRHNSSCYICSKLEFALNDYAETAIYMFKTDESFKKLFKSNKVFCLKHTELLLKAAIKNLNEKDFTDFFEGLKSIQQKNLNCLYESVSEFVNSFDYRSDKPLSEKAKSAIADSTRIL